MAYSNYDAISMLNLLEELSNDSHIVGESIENQTGFCRVFTFIDDIREGWMFASILENHQPYLNVLYSNGKEAVIDFPFFHSSGRIIFLSSEFISRVKSLQEKVSDELQNATQEDEADVMSMIKRDYAAGNIFNVNCWKQYTSSSKAKAVLYLSSVVKQLDSTHIKKLRSIREFENSNDHNIIAALLAFLLAGTEASPVSEYRSAHELLLESITYAYGCYIEDTIEPILAAILPKCEDLNMPHQLFCEGYTSKPKKQRNDKPFDDQVQQVSCTHVGREFQYHCRLEKTTTTADITKSHLLRSERDASIMDIRDLFHHTGFKANLLLDNHFLGSDFVESDYPYKISSYVNRLGRDNPCGCSSAGTFQRHPGKPGKRTAYRDRCAKPAAGRSCAGPWPG